MTIAEGPRSWWRVALAVAAVGWGANQFAPLLLLYRAALDLSTVAVNAAFGLYALGLIPGLLLGGPLSDRVGRRRVLLPALAVSVLASLLLVAGGLDGAAWLFVGRCVAGLASGAAFSAGTAWVIELSGDGSAGPRRATVAMTTGFAGGPLVAGITAQYAPLPVVTAYVPHVALGAVALLMVTGVPEIRNASGLSRSLRIHGLDTPGFRSVLLPLAPWVFATAAVALAYLPELANAPLGGEALLYAAVVTSLAALAGIAVQPLARRLDEPDRPRRLIGLALTLVISGLLVAALSARLTSPALIVVAVLVLGAAYGACQVCGLLLVTRLAPREHLAGLTAAYQAVSYTGFALPFALAAAAPLGSPSALLLVLAVFAAATLAVLLRTRTTAPRHLHHPEVIT